MNANRWRARMPAWSGAAALLVTWLLVRALAPPASSPDGPALAWFAWVILVSQWVWTGIQALGHFTLVALEWMINALWITVREIGAGIRSFGVEFLGGMKKAWQFMRDTYTRVLRPAWTKLWRAVDWARNQLERLFRPVIEFLRRIRAELLKFYDHWIRPILDTIELARKVVRVFASLGLEWAKALDAKLAQLEEQIDRPFRFVLAQLNRITNLINRIVTADGLFQRLALIRSIERDLKFVSRAFVNWRAHPLEGHYYRDARAASRVRPADVVSEDLEDAMLTAGGYYGPLMREAEIAMRQALGL